MWSPDHLLGSPVLWKVVMRFDFLSAWNDEKVCKYIVTADAERRADTFDSAAAIVSLSLHNAGLRKREGCVSIAPGTEHPALTCRSLQEGLDDKSVQCHLER